LRPALAVAVLAALAVAFAPGPVTAQTSFDITGVWDCCGAGGAFPSSWTLTALDQSTGEFSGTGSGGAYTWPTTGRIEGNSLTITTGPYNELPSYTATWTATLAADGQSMTGSWSDTNGQSGTFTTTKSRSIPAPVPGKNVTAVPLSGTVTVKQPGSSQFVPLTTVDSVPVGSTVDVTNGRIALTAAQNLKGKEAVAQFYAGTFKIAQKRAKKPITNLSLQGGDFKGCGSAAKPAGAAQKKKRLVRHLWGDGRGQFRTTGRFAAATIRGTQWDMKDQCNGTLTVVTKGSVTVRDFVKRKSVVVKAGKQYLAARR
jgi:hypothetical protein